MTVRGLQTKSDATGTSHFTTSSSLPAGYDAFLAYDDTKVKTVTQLRAIFNAWLANAQSAGHFTP